MSEMELLVAADLYGTKQNIKFVFPTRPTLKEFVAQVELAFQKEAVLRQAAGVPLQRFEVSNVQVHSEHAQSWVDVVRQGQLAHGCQYYAFQLRGGGGAALRSASRDRRQRQEQQQQLLLQRHTLRAGSPQPHTPRGRAASRDRGGGTPRAGSQQRRGPSATGRRSTSITDRTSHHRDTRARLTRETQAARTLSNDQRYCAFTALAPTGRLDHRCVEPLLLARGADPVLAHSLACATAGMETGPDGCSSFAQFSREFRRHPKLFRTLATLCAQPQPPLSAAAAALVGDGSASPLPLSPPLGLRVAASASPPPEAAVAPAPAMMAPVPAPAAAAAAAALAAPEAELWLEAEISRLEEDHRARIRQLHERYEALQPAPAAAPVAVASPPPAYGYGYEAAATAAAADAAAAAAAASAHTHMMMPGISPPLSPDGHVDAVYQQLADSLAAADVVRRL